jgi:hypothetical protein
MINRTMQRRLGAVLRNSLIHPDVVKTMSPDARKVLIQAIARTIQITNGAYPSVFMKVVTNEPNNSSRDMFDADDGNCDRIHSSDQ